MGMVSFCKLLGVECLVLTAVHVDQAQSGHDVPPNLKQS